MRIPSSAEPYPYDSHMLVNGVEMGTVVVSMRTDNYHRAAAHTEHTLRHDNQHVSRHLYITASICESLDLCKVVNAIVPYGPIVTSGAI